VRATERGLELRDLGSKNGTFIGEIEIVRAFVGAGARIRIGGTTLLLAVRDDAIEHPLATGNALGDIVGVSPAMRRLYPMVERFGTSDGTVLITGETGTGKELFADAIHRASSRRAQPFLVVDCSALPRQLAEAELFGYVRGAFTGADVDREGAFAEANGGTIFLDEVGELPLALQPLLLRVLEAKKVQRIGTSQHREVDVRVIAATHRDLRVEVNARRFRADLYYRLNVLKLDVPPLREREGDVALLAQHFWDQFRPGETIPSELRSELELQSWPGNVRELRNVVERAALVGWQSPSNVAEQTYGQAKDEAMARWERAWIERLLAANDHNVSRAARSVRMARSHLRDLCRRYGLRSRAETES
jgi:transcriptional regulator with GAF, ATPase, and Fis domain